jgi:hypothetical protein
MSRAIIESVKFRKEIKMRATLNTLFFPELNDRNIRINLDLTEEDITSIKELKLILRKCDCRYSEDMATIALPMLDAIIEEAEKIKCNLKQSMRTAKNMNKLI